MKIEGGLIVEISEEELMRYYLDRDMDEIMSFNDYKNGFIRCGCIVLNEKGEICEERFC